MSLATNGRPEPAELHALLERFGHSEFRPGQERVIRALLAGRDVLAVLPTGAGKSLVFQLAAQLLPGLTIVVSPLLALMKDQVDALEQRGLEVGVVNSSQSDGESADELDEALSGQAKLLYVTPERFRSAEFMASLRGAAVSLLVVDEAHCISEWGHDFRPAYLALGGVVERLGRPTVLALTATATPWVRGEIAERLGMRDPVVVVRGVDRPNLFLDVRRVDHERSDRAVLEALVTGQDLEPYPPELRERLGAAMRGSGIVYVATTRAAAETARWLRGLGIAADYYHGQRRKSDRVRVHEQFMAGELRVIAATNAFGMGVDKPDVRFVIHRDVPASVEAYYQEAGRAGRDGELARCVLIYRPGDLGRAAFLAGNGGDGARREYERSRLDMVRGYAELRDCRRRYLLNYFGEEYDGERCDRCDVDALPASEQPVEIAPACDGPAADLPFGIGDRVRHPTWGEGTVQRAAEDSLVVLFETVGYKSLAPEVVLERGLLRGA